MSERRLHARSVERTEEAHVRVAGHGHTVSVEEGGGGHTPGTLRMVVQIAEGGQDALIASERENRFVKDGEVVVEARDDVVEAPELLAMDPEASFQRIEMRLREGQLSDPARGADDRATSGRR